MWDFFAISGIVAWIIIVILICIAIYIIRFLNMSYRKNGIEINKGKESRYRYN